ncbi:MAG: UrcA family protein [Pseudomonadota bacterium]
MSKNTYFIAALCGAMAVAFTPVSQATTKSDSFQFSYTVGDVLKAEKQELVAKRLEREASRFCRSHVGFGRSILDRTYCRTEIVQAVNKAISKRYPTWNKRQK